MSFQLSKPALAAVILTTLGAGSAFAGCGGEVRFQSGSDHGTVRGTVSGYDTCDYTLTARKGQVLSVDMGRSGNVEAHVVAPVEHMLAAEDLVLPQSGQYTIRVLQPRAMARKGKAADFAMTVRVRNGASAAAAPVSQPATKAGSTAGTICEGSGAFVDGTANMSGRIMGSGTCTWTFNGKKGQVVTPMMDAPAGFEAWITAPVNELLVADQPLTLTQTGTYTVTAGLTRNAARKASKPVDFSLLLNAE
ncbi:hypothetical protein [Paracoccus jiaweipingae]|uniref:hypothetical protein n=1 Tax=unclassified Paracoccus (in: a-proteobacteria) TaxID=2688777 RepID=UPI0037B54F0D